MASSGSEYDLAVAAESLEFSSSDSSGHHEPIRVKLAVPINLPAVPEYAGGANAPGRCPGNHVARSASDSSKPSVKVQGKSNPNYNPIVRPKRSYSTGRDAPYVPVQRSASPEIVQLSRSRPLPSASAADRTYESPGRRPGKQRSVDPFSWEAMGSGHVYVDPQVLVQGAAPARHLRPLTASPAPDRRGRHR